MHVQELDVATTPPMCPLLFPPLLLQQVIFFDTSWNRLQTEPFWIIMEFDLDQILFIHYVIIEVIVSSLFVLKRWVMICPEWLVCYFTLLDNLATLCCVVHYLRPNLDLQCRNWSATFCIAIWYAGSPTNVGGNTTDVQLPVGSTGTPAAITVVAVIGWVLLLGVVLYAVFHLYRYKRRKRKYKVWAGDLCDSVDGSL